MLESVYSYFSYDVNTYIATKLGTWTRPPPVTEAAATVSESSDTSHSDNSPMETQTLGGHFHRFSSSSDESTVARSSNSKIINCTSPSLDDSRSESNSTNRKKPPNKSVSSFTVENILMGKGRQRSSSSSTLPTTSGSFSAPPPPNASSATNNHSSVVGTNWVSHPPVKYTKFTMLSPTSMADETQKKKKTEGMAEVQWHGSGGRDSSQNSSSSDDLSQDLKRTTTPPASLSGSVDLSTSFVVKNAIQKPRSFGRSSSSGNPSPHSNKESAPLSSSSLPPSSSSLLHTLQTQNILQTAKMSALPVVQAVPTTPDVKTAVLHQTFPASGQQVVLLIPSNSTSIGGSLPTVFYTNPVLSLGQSTGSPTSSGAKLPGCSPTTSDGASGASQPNEDRASPSAHQRHHVEFDEKASPQDQSESYRPIAPKAATTTESASHDHHDSKSNDKMKLYLKRTMPKPPKLRFHMTTVMKQPKGNTVMTSLTAQSPQAIASETAERGPLSAAPDGEQQRHSRSELAVESTITRSPNVYSNESTQQKHRAGLWAKREQDLSSSPTQASPQINSVSSATDKNTASKNGTSSKPQTTVLKDSGFHLQLVKQQGGNSNKQPQHQSATKDQETGELRLQKGARQNGRQTGSGRGRGRTTRSYTRRKRELTFHLYEDPSTAFRAKRQCRDREQQ